MHSKHTLGYNWQHVVLILLQSAFFSLSILFLRIIHVDADRKLNSISDSKNTPAH